MRPISAPEALESAVTRPVYLVRLGFNPPVHLSTAQEVSWGGYTWSPFGVRVNNIDLDATGSAKVSVSISNLDRTFGVLVLGQAAKDREAAVYVYYPEGPIEPMTLVNGVMDGASVGDDVNISIISRSASYGKSPRILCSPPVFNHLPPSGTTLRWGYSSVILERR